VQVIAGWPGCPGCPPPPPLRETLAENIIFGLAVDICIFPVNEFFTDTNVFPLRGAIGRGVLGFTLTSV
jgi:hypothetical protein